VERRKERSPGGPALAGAVALLVIGLLTLVTLAAGGGHSIWHGRLTARPVPNSVQDTSITLLAIAYVVAIAGVLVAMFRRRHRWKDPDSHWLRNYAAFLALMLVITGAGYVALTHGHLRERGQALLGLQAQQGQARGSKPAAGNPLPPRRAHVQWPLVLALGGLVLLGGVWVLVKRNRRPAHEFSAGDTVEEELARAIGSTIADLRAERDTRRAVIAAYANMERILASHGLERRAAEVPYEYLARVLHLLQVRESAAGELTELFEYAKFSDHEVDPAMKERAIESLVIVKDDLQASRELAA
jgi:hypothetical protein